MNPKDNLITRSLNNIQNVARQRFKPAIQNFQQVQSNLGNFKPVLSQNLSPINRQTMGSNVQSFLNRPVNLPRPVNRTVNFLNSNPVNTLTAFPKAVGDRSAQLIGDSARSFSKPGMGNKAIGALQLLGGASNLTPIGLGANAAESGVASVLQSIRTKTNPVKNFISNTRNPYTGVASTGLGLTGPAAAVGDIALASPEQLARINPKKIKNAAGTLLGFGAGRNSQMKWNQQDLVEFEQANDILRGNKKLTPQQQEFVDKQFTRLAQGYLYKDTIEKLASRNPKNQRQFLIDMSKQLQKSVSRVGEEEVFKLPKLGIVGESPNVATKIPLKADGTVDRTQLRGKQLNTPNDILLETARKQIGSLADEPKKPLKQVANDIYTQWVDRFNPITKASEFAGKKLRAKGAQLRPEFDPQYLVRRLTGASGIADYRYQTELKPIIDQLDTAKIDKTDMDVYLKARRDIGLAERGIKGSDAQQASQVIAAIDQKYGESIKHVAQQLYDYQNKGFQEMIDAGFLNKETGDLIRQQNPDYVPFQRIMEEMTDYLGLPTRKAQQATQPIKKIKGSDKAINSPIEEIMANTFTQRAAIEKNRVAKSIVGLQRIAPELGFTQSAKSGDDTITIWNNGQKEYWKVGREIAESVKGVNEENMNTLLKIFTAPANLLRQGATGRNPEFMLPNIIRDQLDAGVASKYGYVPFIDYVRGLQSILGNDKYYQGWQRSGAKIDLGELSGRKSIKESFDQSKAKNGLFKWLNSALDTMGKYSEQPTRVGLYKKALKKTGNETLAMMESRDSTVDFARMGSKMKVANSVIPFLNVGVQGFDKLIRSVKNNPGKVALTMGTYAALPQIMTSLYNLTNYREEYAEIPQYVKDGNLVLVTGRNDQGNVEYITIPKGNIMPVVANPIENFMSYLAGVDQQSFSQLATNLLSSTLPVLGDGSTPKEVAIKTIGSNLPQLVKPATENLLNKSFYKYDSKKEDSKEIVPYYLKDKPPAEQAFEYTPSMYKTVGKVINVSPLQVQNFMEGYFAGYSKIPAQLVDAMKNISEGNTVPINQRTLLRRFVAETYPSKKQKVEVNKARVPLFAQANASDQELPTNPEDLKILIKEDQDVIDKYNEKRIKIQYGSDEDYKKKTDLENLELEFQAAKERMGTIRQQDPQLAKDFDYYNLAKKTEDEKLETILSRLETLPTGTNALEALAPLRKEVDGERVLSNGVIDSLYNENIISKSQKDYLKSIKDRAGKLVVKSKAPRFKKISPVKVKRLKAKLPKKLKVKKLKLKSVKL